LTVPAWAQDTIYYQIFPDRFANGDRSNDPVNVRRWGSLPDGIHFQGGDLRGIIQRLDYLSDLGVDSIYLNPIFLSSSNHRYNTIDYYQIDPRLGTQADFEELVRSLHARGMRLILDGVFNHCGRGFFAFVDLLENGRDSPYLDWFHIHRFPLEAYAKGETRNYTAWWGIKSLPKFNTANPKVREYIFGVARHWIEQGADGWRLDVPNEIDDDEFWAEFREAVKQVNPEAVLIGEIWEVQPRWLNESHFDSLMNYPLRTAILDFLQWGKSGAQTAEAIGRVMSAYPWENTLALYNLLGSHDTERVKTMLAGRQNALRLAYLLQFALPGAPAIYYGDEIGLEGGKDPDCRRTFPWDENKWDRDLRDWIKALIRTRKTQPALRRGLIEMVYASDHAPLLAFKRVLDGETILAAVNGSDQSQALGFRMSRSSLPVEATLNDLLGQPISARLKDGLISVDLPPYTGAYFRIG
jgi:glycosidase